MIVQFSLSLSPLCSSHRRADKDHLRMLMILMEVRDSIILYLIVWSALCASVYTVRLVFL